MALLTEPTSSTPDKKRRNSPPVRSSGSDSPDSSALLRVIESLKTRIEQLENKTELDDEDREALRDLKTTLKHKKAQAAQREDSGDQPAVTSHKSHGAGFWDDDDE